MARNADRKYEAAVRIVDIEREDRTRLEHYLQQLNSRPRAGAPAGGPSGPEPGDDGAV